MIKNTSVGAVAEDIIHMKFKSSDTIQGCMKKFYTIMRRYGIKQGTKVGIGIQRSNPEWTICFTMFKNTFTCYLDINDLFNKAPKDLRY
jgi:hypothetical protein